jgi:hypothetical protein
MRDYNNDLKLRDSEFESLRISAELERSSLKTKVDEANSRIYSLEVLLLKH